MLGSAQQTGAVEAVERLETHFIGTTVEDCASTTAANHFSRIRDRLQSRSYAGRDGRINAAQVMDDGGLTGGGIDHGIGKVHRARIGWSSFKRATVKLRNRM